MTESIVSLMREQHKVLKEELIVIMSIVKDGDVNAKVVVDGLAKFRSDLDDHLTLENKIFYPGLLKTMKEHGDDISTTEIFIDEMDFIEKTAISILEKYETVESIEKSLPKFSQELESLINVLVLRIESEEDGVYGYEQMMG